MCGAVCRAERARANVDRYGVQIARRRPNTQTLSKPYNRPIRTQGGVPPRPHFGDVPSPETAVARHTTTRRRVALAHTMRAGVARHVTVSMARDRGRRTRDSARHGGGKVAARMGWSMLLAVLACATSFHGVTRAHGAVLSAWNASDESIVSPLRCQRRAVFGECVQEVGCAWCDAREVNGANPACYSLLDSALCASHLEPIMYVPKIVDAVNNVVETPCDVRCTSIGSQEHCQSETGCGWCGASGLCLSGSVDNGPCQACAYDWKYYKATPTCKGASSGAYCTACDCKNGGECAETSKECLCPVGVTGSLCQFNTTTNSGRDACNGHGTWNATALDCVCDTGYVGVGDNRCKFSCSPSVDCNGNGYCSELDGSCMCDVGFAGERCNCLSTALTSFPYPDALLNSNKTGCCPYGYEECPSPALNAGQCVLSPATVGSERCPTDTKDDGTLVMFGLLLFLLGMYLSAAIITVFQGNPTPTCTIVCRLPTIVRLRDSLFMRHAEDVDEPRTITVTCKLTDNFQKVKRMICRRLKHQPDPDVVDLFYLGCLVESGWRLGDGIQVGQTCHVHMKLRGGQQTEVYTDKKKNLRRLRYIFNDNFIVGCVYFAAFLTLGLCARTYSWDSKPVTTYVPPPPPPSPPPPSPPPMPPAPSPPPMLLSPSPPPADWVDWLNLQNTARTNTTFGTNSTFSGSSELGQIPADILALEAIEAQYDNTLTVTSNYTTEVVNYYTYEDAPLWTRELPLFVSNSGVTFLVETIVSVCDPVKDVDAVFDISMSGGYGVLSYQPDANENGVDVFTFRGIILKTVAEALGLVADGTIDCSAATMSALDQSGYTGYCYTDIREVRIYIETRNDRPVAAYGLQILSFENSAYVIPMRTGDDYSVTSSSLRETLVATDVDGDRLTYTIEQQPLYGEIITSLSSESSTFEYVPAINFTGYDYFVYSVNDGLSNTPEETMWDTASVIVAVGSATGQPQAVDTHYWVHEDTTMTARFGRSLIAADYNVALKYEVTSVSNGTVTLLCTGKGEVEVWENEECSLNSDKNENYQYFNYTPSGNFSGSDVIEYRITPATDGGFPATSGKVTIDVYPVNDPPTLPDMEIVAVMNRNRDAADVGDSDLTAITFKPDDVDAGYTFRLFLTLKTPRADQPDWATRPRGKWYRGRDRYGRPQSELTATELDQDGILSNGTSIELYYLAPPMRYGYYTPTSTNRPNPLEKYRVRVADDGLLVSNEATLNIHVGCSQGYTVQMSSTSSNTVQVYGMCTECPLGQVTDEVNSRSCRPCPVGMAGGTVQRGTCSRCNAGYYADQPGLSKCSQCPSGSTSVEGATSLNQCFCNIGWYGVPGYCHPCPTYSESYGVPEMWTYCAEANLTVPFPQPGFYVVSEPTRDVSEPVSIRQCFPYKACPGVKGLAGSKQVDTIAAGGVEADEMQCADGYNNEGCDTCDATHYRLNGKCEACGKREVHAFYGLIAASVVFFAAAMPWLVEETSFAYVIQSRMIALVVFLQEVGLIGRYNLGWNDHKSLSTLMQFCFILQLNPEVIGLECITEYSFVERWQSLMAMPALGLGLLFACAQIYAYVFGKFYIKMKSHVEVVRVGQRRWVKMLRSILNLIQVTYVSVVIATLDFFVFHRSVTDRFGYIRAQPNLRFGFFSTASGSTTWQKLFPLGLAAVFLYPIGFIVIMYSTISYAQRGWNKLWKRDLIGFATYQFTDDYVWFRVMEMGRMFALCAIQLLAYELNNGSGVVQALAALLVVGTSFASVIMRPFKTTEARRVLGLHLLSIVIVLMLSVVSMAPVSYIIDQRTKENAESGVWSSICVTVAFFVLNILFEAYQNTVLFKRIKYALINFSQNMLLRIFRLFGKSRSKWLRQKAWVHWSPALTMLNPQAGAILKLESAEGDQGLDYSGNFDMASRLEFTRALRSLMRHRQVIHALTKRDDRVKSFRKMLSQGTRKRLLRAAAVDDRDLNRRVTLFIEKEMMGKHYNFYRKHYRQALKDIRGAKSARNPPVEQFLLRDSTLKRANSKSAEQQLKADAEKEALAAYDALDELNSVTRALQSDTGDMGNLDDEQIFFQTADVDERTKFVRFAGYFGDISPDWDALDESLAKAKAENRDEDGEVLPWHLESEMPADDFCCLCECEPGERCARHGNLYVLIAEDEEDAKRVKAERERHFRTRETIIIHEEDPDRARDLGWNVRVPVRLNETVPEVHEKLAAELRDMRDRGEFGGEDELPAVSGKRFDIIHKGKVLEDMNTVKIEHLQWKAEVQIENRRGNLAKTTAWLILDEDIEAVSTRPTFARTEEEEMPVYDTPISADISTNPQMTVGDLRKMMAEANQKPSMRTILRYRAPEKLGKELIRDSTFLTAKSITKPGDVTVSFEGEDGTYYVWSEIRAHWSFLEGVFKVYASLPSGPNDTESRGHLDDHLLMSYRQFMYLMSGCKVGDKLPNTQFNQLASVVRSVFDAVKSNESLANCLFLDRNTGALEGSLCPSEGPRLELRLSHGWGMHLDEYLTSLVFMSWIVYGHRVPMTDRGVARATRWFIERVMKPNCTHLIEEYELQAEYAKAAAKYGELGQSEVALISEVYKQFATSGDGMTKSEFKAAAEWTVGKDNPLNKYSELVFSSHTSFASSAPEWCFLGARQGFVHSIDEKPDGYVCCTEQRLPANKFASAFGDLCFRAIPGKGPIAEKIQKAFAVAQERVPIANMGLERRHAVIEEPSDARARKALVGGKQCPLCGKTDHVAEDCPHNYAFSCPNCGRTCEPEDLVVSERDGEQYCGECVPEAFTCPNCSTPCEPEDVIVDEEDGSEYCPACVPEVARMHSGRQFDCPNCGEPCAAADIFELEGVEYCPACIPLDDEDIARPVFSAPKKQEAPPKQRERVVRVRKVTRVMNDDEQIARPQGFSAPKPAPAPARRREARVRTVTTTVHGDERIARPQGFARAVSRRDREDAEERARDADYDPARAAGRL